MNNPYKKPKNFN